MQTSSFATWTKGRRARPRKRRRSSFTPPCGATADSKDGRSGVAPRERSYAGIRTNGRHPGGATGLHSDCSRSPRPSGLGKDAVQRTSYLTTNACVQKHDRNLPSSTFRILRHVHGSERRYSKPIPMADIWPCGSWPLRCGFSVVKVNPQSSRYRSASDRQDS